MALFLGLYRSLGIWLKKRKTQIRNSTVDFLVITKDAHEDGIEVLLQNTLRIFFLKVELEEKSVCAKFAQTADDGKTYQYKFYSLAAIIAVGYRTNSERALQFRQWETKELEIFTKQGYVLDKNRLINGQIFDEDYFEHCKWHFFLVNVPLWIN